jgi:hypothetical protein
MSCKHGQRGVCERCILERERDEMRAYAEAILPLARAYRTHIFDESKNYLRHSIETRIALEAKLAEIDAALAKNPAILTATEVMKRNARSEAPDQAMILAPLVDKLGAFLKSNESHAQGGSFGSKWGRACAACGQPVYAPMNRYEAAATCMGDRIWHGRCFPKEGVTETFTTNEGNEGSHS